MVGLRGAPLPNYGDLSGLTGSSFLGTNSLVGGSGIYEDPIGTLGNGQNLFGRNPLTFGSSLSPLASLGGIPGSFGASPGGLGSFPNGLNYAPGGLGTRGTFPSAFGQGAGTLGGLGNYPGLTNGVFGATPGALGLPGSSRFGLGSIPNGFGGTFPQSIGTGLLGSNFGTPGGFGLPSSGSLGRLGRYPGYPGSFGSLGAYPIGFGTNGAAFSHNQNNLGYHYDLTLPGGNYQTVSYANLY